MAEVIKSIKIRLCVTKEESGLLQETVNQYRDVCNYVSKLIFDETQDPDFKLNTNKLVKKYYSILRQKYTLNSQMIQSAVRDAAAKYKTKLTQLKQKPMKFRDTDGKTYTIKKDLSWMQKPIEFRKPYASCVRCSNYSFAENGTKLSIGTLRGRIKLPFYMQNAYKKYIYDIKNLGTATLLRSDGKWYLAVSLKEYSLTDFIREKPAHIVGIDRGLRFFAVAYDENGKVTFFSGKEYIQRRKYFARRRAKLQKLGTVSARRLLKRLAKRENRWMSYVNHVLSETLVNIYGPGTLFVIEDLTDISFSEAILDSLTPEERSQFRSWAFYEFEQMLTYKAEQTGSYVLKVSPEYTSQRCPVCGEIHKESRNLRTHEYHCIHCGYRSNDDRIAAMNLCELGKEYVSGNDEPHIEKAA